MHVYIYVYIYVCVCTLLYCFISAFLSKAGYCKRIEIVVHLTFFTNICLYMYEIIDIMFYNLLYLIMCISVF